MKAEVLDSRINQYILVRDTWTGSGGFADGDYLYTFGRENNPAKRKEMASYSNYLKPIISAQVDPIFTSPPTRVYTPDTLLEAFIKNVDNNGTNLQDLTKKYVTQTTLMSNYFVIMDNFGDAPLSKADAVRSRKFPYVYKKSLCDLKEYETDEFGALTSITFYYGVTHNAELNEQSKVYRTFDDGGVVEYAKDKQRDGSYKERVLAVSEYDLGGRLPVVCHNKDEIAPFPSYYSIAKQSQKIYNAESETNDLARSQNFSILLIPSINAGSDQKEAVIVGKDNALFYDSESGKAPSYISPDSAIMESSLSYIANCTTTLIQSADVLGSTAVQRGSKAESGVALSFKFFGKQQALKNSARMAEDFEREVIVLLGLFLGGKEIAFDVVYDDRFTPTYDEVVMRLASLRELLEMNINEDINKQLFKDIVAMVAVQNNWSEDVHKKLSDSIVSGVYEPSVDEGINVEGRVMRQ